MGRWLAVAVAVGCWLLAPADTSAYVYWADYTADAIGRANLDGSGVDQTFITGASNAGGVAVDGRYIYWSARAMPTQTRPRNAIVRANLDGTGVRQQLLVGYGASDLEVHGQYIYWTNYVTNTIGRASLDGSGFEKSFISAKGPFGVAVDSRYIYWTFDGTPADVSPADTIGRANLDGSAGQSFIAGTEGLYGVAVDGQYIYWGNSLGHTIGRANLDGSGVNHSFITGISGAWLAVDAQYVYWANGRGTIGRANLDGSGVEDSFITITRGGYAGAVAVDGGGVSGDDDAGSPTPDGWPRFTVCTIPDVQALVLRDARDLIVAAGCKLGRVTRRYARYPSGWIVRQRPAAGSQVGLGGRVNIAISRGAKPKNKPRGGKGGRGRVASASRWPWLTATVREKQAPRSGR